MTKQRIPAAACQLRTSPLEFADLPAEELQTVATILARTGDSIPHWFFGKIVHDFAGMQMTKCRLALDYCHDPADIIGYAEDWDSKSGNLMCRGVLLTAQSPRASEIMSLAKAGVPYEASISFNPLKMQRLTAGEQAQINGRLVEGPAVIVRQWMLTGLAVCPRGADANTRTQFTGPEAGDLEVEFLDGERSMSKGTTPDDAALRAQIQEELTARLQDYTTRFGAAGQGWALSDRPLVECYQDHVESLTARHEQALSAASERHEAELGKLQTDLAAAVERAAKAEEKLHSLSLPGEPTPVSSGAAEKEEPENKRLSELKEILPDGLAEFAAGLKLPKNDD
jgi:hypothetical protein